MKTKRQIANYKYQKSTHHEKTKMQILINYFYYQKFVIYNLIFGAVSKQS